MKESALAPKAEAGPGGNAVPQAVGRALQFYRERTGDSLVPWAGVAVLNFAAEIVFRRNFAAGEFGTLNTVLAIVGLMTLPVLAVDRAFAWYLAQNHAADQAERLAGLRASAGLVTETCGWVWGGISVLLLAACLPLLKLPRLPIDLFTLVIVLLAIGGVVSGALRAEGKRQRSWGWMLVGAALVRVASGAWLAGFEPWAETGLAASVFAGFVTLLPTLTQAETGAGLRFKAMRTLLDVDFLRYFAATFSVLLGIFLFTSGDRLVGQSWFGVVTNLNLGFVDWRAFDAYQTAGLLGRALVWGTQPLLWLLLAHRSAQNRTTLASLSWFWIYLGALVGGSILLLMFKEPLSALFCGKDFTRTAQFVPSFAVTMVPLGLLQGLGVFVLASRRLIECHVFGGLGVAYALMLYLVARQAEMMPVYMLGGSFVAMTVLLGVGIARWGRQPERILWNESKRSR